MPDIIKLIYCVIIYLLKKMCLEIKMQQGIYLPSIFVTLLAADFYLKSKIKVLT